MFLYAAENIRGWRQLAIGPGKKIKAEVASFYEEQIWHWIFNNWRPAYAMWGLTKDLMFLMMVRWMSISVKTWGFSWSVGLVAAKANMLKFISVGATAAAVPLLTLWVGLLLINPVIWFIELWQKQWGINILPPVACILTYKELSQWAALYKRRGTGEFEMIAGPMTNIPAYLHLKKERDAFGIYDEWQFHDLWIESGKGTIYHYAYGYTEMRLTFVGKVTRLGETLYVASENFPKWWTDTFWPGWEITHEEALAYTYTLHEDFKV